MTYRLPTIPHLRLRFTLEAAEPARLPPFKGSMLRGAFGRALRRLACTMGPRQACAPCPLRRECAYARLYEGRIEGEPPPFLGGLPTPPRPYLFEPETGAAGERRDFAPGDPLRFDLLLFGRAAGLQAHTAVAVDRMAGGGLGARRHRFRLVRIEHPVSAAAWRTVYRAGGAAWSEPAPALPPDTLSLGDTATLHLLTPLRLRNGRRLATDFSFRRLAFLMLRRALEIAHFHVPGAEPDWRLRPLLERASAVRLVEPRLAWRDFARWSNRQRAKVPLGGLVGRVRLAGDLTPFAPLLAAAQTLHVGKGATVGLGRIAVEAG